MTIFIFTVTINGKHEVGQSNSYLNLLKRLIHSSLPAGLARVVTFPTMTQLIGCLSLRGCPLSTACAERVWCDVARQEVLKGLCHILLPQEGIFFEYF